MINVPHCPEVSLFSNTTPNSIDAFVPSWHECQNSIKLEIRILHAQLLTNRHFHFLITQYNHYFQYYFSSPNKWPVTRCDPSAWHWNPTQHTSDILQSFYRQSHDHPPYFLATEISLARSSIPQQCESGNGCSQTVLCLHGHWPFTTVVQLRSKARLCGIFVDTVALGKVFCQVLRFFPISISAPHSFVHQSQILYTSSNWVTK